MREAGERGTGHSDGDLCASSSDGLGLLDGYWDCLALQHQHSVDRGEPTTDLWAVYLAGGAALCMLCPVACIFGIGHLRKARTWSATIRSGARGVLLP